MSLGLKALSPQAGHEPLALPNLALAVRMLRFNLRDCVVVACSLEPSGVMKTANVVQAIVSVVFFGHGSSPTQRELSIYSRPPSG